MFIWSRASSHKRPSHHYRKCSALVYVTDTFFVSRGCPLARVFTVFLLGKPRQRVFSPLLSLIRSLWEYSVASGACSCLATPVSENISSWPYKPESTALGVVTGAVFWYFKERFSLYYLTIFPYGAFRMETQDYLFRCSVAPRNFPLDGTTQKVVKVVTSQPNFPETFCKR